MIALQKLQIIIHSISVMAIFVTLGINYLQFRKMTEQVAAMQRGADAQQILSMVSFIESDEVREALMVVYTTLHRKHFNEWTESELHAASRICASFATVGAIVRSGLVPAEPLLQGWGPSLRRCYQILEPFLREMQKSENGGPQYWIGFDWLYSQLDRPKAAKAVMQKAQNLRRDGRGPNTQAISKHRMAEENNVG